jgi:crossover junction endodeoxyribonuclease RuvC
MVNTFLRLPEIPAADATDALAIAICHLNHARAAPVRGLEPSGAGQRKIGIEQRAVPAYHRFEGRSG